MPQIKDSLYEQLNPLTTVAGQHFVEDFSGDTLDTFRWTQLWTNVSSGGNVAGMSDEIGGGYYQTNTTDANSSGCISFGSAMFTAGTQMKQFSHLGSTVIWVAKISTFANFNFNCGLSEASRGDGAGNNALINFPYGSNFGARTCGSTGSQSNLDSGVTGDTNYHSHKMSCDSTFASYTLDGVFTSTATTNLPASNMQPVGGFGKHSAAGTWTLNLKYCEAWNH